MSYQTKNLAERSLHAIKWNYLGTIGRALAQFVSVVVLARLLGPEPTGLFGYALLLISFAALVTEMGLSAALVQAPSLSRVQLGSVASRLLLVAIIFSFLIFVIAEWIATKLVNAPQVTLILQAIAPSLIISALSIPPAAVLKRKMQFRALTIIGISSYIFGYIFVGIGVALLGGGVWSLVAAWYAQNIVACIALNFNTRETLAFANPLGFAKIGNFGGIIMVTYLFNWIIDNATNFVIGRVLGPAQLGAFTVTNNLVRTPAGHLVTNLQTVLFPASALAQDNPAALRRAYLTAMAGVAFVALPLFAGAAAASSLVVDALLGEKWEAARVLFSPLALAMIPHCLMAIAGPMLGGKGEPIAELVVQAATAIVLVAALFVIASFGLKTLAWSLVAIFLLRFLGMTYALARRISVSFVDLTEALRGGIILGGVAASTAFGIEYLVNILDFGLAPAFCLGLVIIGIVIACLIFLISLPQLCLDSRLSWLVSRFFGQHAAILKLPFMQRVASQLNNSTSSS